MKTMFVKSSLVNKSYLTKDKLYKVINRRICGFVDVLDDNGRLITIIADYNTVDNCPELNFKSRWKIVNKKS